MQYAQCCPLKSTNSLGLPIDDSTDPQQGFLTAAFLFMLSSLITNLARDTFPSGCRYYQCVPETAPAPPVSGGRRLQQQATATSPVATPVTQWLQCGGKLSPHCPPQ